MCNYFGRNGTCFPRRCWLESLLLGHPRLLLGSGGRSRESPCQCLQFRAQQTPTFTGWPVWTSAPQSPFSFSRVIPWDEVRLVSSFFVPSFPWILAPLFTYLSKIVTWQFGLSSVRVGEASHPGPGSSPSNEPLVLPQVNKRPRSASPARPSHPSPLSLGRWYCPVSSCPDRCQESSRGWTSFKGLRFHLDLHFMGDLSGQVPLDWLHQQGYGVCSACNRVLSSHSNGLHPRCYRASVGASVQAPPLSVDPSSTGHLVCLMSPPPTVDSALRSPLVPETSGASASSMHLRRWLPIALGSTSSPCLP